jgi:uncharacterized protein
MRKLLKFQIATDEYKWRWLTRIEFGFLINGIADILTSRAAAMRPSQALELHREAIRRIVLENRSTNPRVFGSVLHEHDTESSDLDLLIDPTSDTSLMDVASIQEQLEDILGIPVDVLTPLSLPNSFRGRVVAEARPV